MTKKSPKTPAKPEAVVAEEVAPAIVKPSAKKAASGPSRKVALKKAATIKKFQNHVNDTGSTDVQVAVLTEKINQLSKHLEGHKKDNDSRSGLLKMISHRRSLLSYLDKRHPEQYRKIIAQLGLRK